jgi:diguanylate cyclase (GGDEF)-like protein
MAKSLFHGATRWLNAPSVLAVEDSLLDIAYANLAPMLGMTAMAGLGAALIFAAAGDVWPWMWLAALLALTALRFVGGKRFERARSPGYQAGQMERWKHWYALGLYASAMLWIAPAILVAHHTSAGQYTYAIILSALAAGGTGIMAALKREGRIYIALMLGPPTVFVFWSAESGPVMIALGLVFLCVMLVVHARNHAILHRSVELQLENMTLVQNLRALNAGLETKVAERTQALLDAANHDNLTSLPNRRGLIGWMQTHLDPIHAQAGAVLFLDLDRFKQVNDAMGHDVGDRVLLMVACRLAAAVPENAILARWGGDEFVLVVAAETEPRDQAHCIAQELVRVIAQPFEVNGQSVSLGLSVGVSFFPSDATDHRSLILAADLAVAEVKRNGRGQVFDYRNSYAATQKRRFDLSRALGAAVDADELEVHFQPIIATATGHVHAYEALTRWRHPELGPISPDEFIRVAEETDRIVALGDSVLRRACSAAAAWTRPSFAPKVAVNVSVKQLREEGFALRVMQILTQAGLPAARLELEVTESLFAEENPRVRDTIESLRAIGVTFSIDDFGTGYSSLSRLQSLAVSAVKIDKSFVSDLDGRGAIIIESTLMIARRLGLSVVAEGVETREQSRKLVGMGVDFLQGYYYGKPAPEVLEPATYVVEIQARRAS